MKIKHLAAIGLASLLFASTLTACSSDNTADQSGSASGSNSGESVELNFWIVAQEGAAKENWQQMIKDFEAANPGITVAMEMRSNDAHKDAMRQTAGTNVGPDAFYYWAGPGQAGELVKAGVSKDLTDYYSSLGWDERFIDAAMESVTQYGGYNGVPYVISTQPIYYNKALFEKAGIKEFPKTYDELVTAAEKLKTAGITPITFGGSVNWHVQRLLDALIETKCGADIADQLTSKETDWAAQSCVTEAFTELKKWGDNYLPEGFMSLADFEARNFFFSGEAAMAIEGQNMNSWILDHEMSADDIGVALFPTGTDRMYTYIQALYMGSQTKHPDETAKFLDFIMSDETQQKYGSAWAGISVNKNVEPDYDANAIFEQWPALFENSEGTYINNDQNLSVNETTEFWRLQNSVILGDIAPSDAGAQMQKFFDNES